MSREPIRVVLGPVGGTGFVAALEAVPGVGTVTPGTMDEVGAALADGDVLVTYRWSDDWITPRLRWIQSISAGTDQYPLDSLADAEVVLTSAVGIHDVQVSEHALGLLLAMTRGIATSVRHQADRRWQWSPVIDLDGMTLAVLGLGTIGEAVARKASALGMRVIGTKRNPAEYRGAAAEVFGPADTLEVFRRADAVIVALPGTSATTRLIGSAELEALAGGFLVNVGRGSVIDEAALIAALEAGTLAGAALDVFEAEPLPDSSPLWEHPAVIVTPHQAGDSPRYAERLADLFARNLAALHGEAEWVNRVV